MKINTINKNEFEIVSENGNIIIDAKSNKPFIYLGFGKEKMEMYRGNFDISDYLTERVPLKATGVVKDREDCIVTLKKNENDVEEMVIKITENKDSVNIKFLTQTYKANRIWIRSGSNTSEKVYGCGEQLTYFNMKGKKFPLWTSEPGVGRNKNFYTTWLADVKDRAGGDYYNTNYPQPTYISSNKYFFHVETTCYSVFDFSNEEFTEMEVWGIPEFIHIQEAKTFLLLVEKISNYFGKQPELPEWVYDGIILGIQGGTELVYEKVKRAKELGVKISGVWCQDWEGIRMTSFGKRLMWNWEWDRDVYPELDKKIWKLKESGIRFLGYINPYLAEEKDLFKEASQKGYLALNDKNEDYLVDFGEFYAGIVDFTNIEAAKWYKDRVIGENMIDFGLDGWMADFGEYLPIDCILSNGVDAKIMHNAWPTLWAKVNYEAVEEAGKLGKIVYFMRAGFTGIQKYCTLLWAGDQSVDWPVDDGLASVVCGALSSGMLGNGLHHSDIGGYTTLHGMKRTKELFMRWAEMGSFTPFLRTHEGNRPGDNHQFDSDDETLEHLAVMTGIYVKLVPYIKMLVKENAKKGIPVQRPLFLHNENDINCYDIKYQYMLGEDIIVAPVYDKGAEEWEVYLPKGEKWVHFWSGKTYEGGSSIKVKSPIGQIPAFYKKGSKYTEIFISAAKENPMRRWNVE